MTTQGYKQESVRIEIPSPYYLNQHEISRYHITNFTQASNTAELLHLTFNPYSTVRLKIGFGSIHKDKSDLKNLTKKNFKNV